MMHHLKRSPARPVADHARARADRADNLGTVSQHQDWSFFNVREPKCPHVTATLIRLEALGASYPAWYDSAPGGAD